MFQFSTFAHLCVRSSIGQVSPFGNPRINSYLLIPAAYRSLSRPSSPLRAKASPVYPFLLSSTHTPFARMVCFFDSCCIFRIKIQEPRIKTEVSFLFLFSFFFRVTAVLYTVVFSFNLLLPICQRTFFRFAVLSLQFAVLTAYCPLFTAN